MAPPTTGGDNPCFTIGGVSMRLPALLAYSARMPTSLISLPVVAISDFIAAANSAGEPAMTSAPESKSRRFTSALLRTRTICRFSRSMIGAGVLAGAKMPKFAFDSYPGSPEAATVGKPGANADG